MSNWDYAQVTPTEEWRSAMTIPRELKLVKSGNIYLVQSTPVAEFESLVEAPSPLESGSTVLIENYKIGVTGIVEGSFELNLKNSEGDSVVIAMSEGVISIDRKNSGLTDFSEKFASLDKSDPLDVELNKLEVYVDASSIEVFANEGLIVMTEQVFPSSPLTTIDYSGEAESVVIQPIKSIWN